MLSQSTNPEIAASRPLFVYLEGTLVQRDALDEWVALLVRKQPAFLLHLLFWFLRGRKYWRRRVVEEIVRYPSLIPLQQSVVARVQSEQIERSVFLLSQEGDPIGKAVAARLGLSQRAIPPGLAPEEQQELLLRDLADQFGANGFDYLGRYDTDGAEADPSERRLHPLLVSLAHLLRFHQWTKNLLVFVPLVTGHQLFSAGIFLKTLMMFLAISCCASANYVLNDILDLEADRQHARKKTRPLANAEIRIPTALAIALCLLFVGFGTAAAALPLSAAAVLTLYCVVTIAYSAWWKRIVLVDVFVLTSLYLVRVFGGGAASGIRVSEWTTAFFFFIFLSLALLKRYVELCHLANNINNIGSVPGRGYQTSDSSFVSQCGISAGLLSVLVFALYINSPDVHALYLHPMRLWLLCPLIAFAILRFWIMGHRGELQDDPVLFAVTDRITHMLVVLGAILVLAATV